MHEYAENKIFICAICCIKTCHFKRPLCTRKQEVKMQQSKNNVLTPSAFVTIVIRGLGFVVSNYFRPGVIGNQFLKKRLVSFQAINYITTSILPMFDLKERNISLSQKQKRRRSLIWKVRQFCKFWQPIIALATAILAFLMMIWREFVSN